MRLRGALRRILEPPPVRARHTEYSMLFSADDAVPPSDRLLQTALAAADRARTLDLSSLSRRLPPGPAWPEIWPGEHYRLLAGLVDVLEPRVVVEIGTATGLSALALLERLPAGGRLSTFDIVGWRDQGAAVLRDEDFADGRLVQHVDDLSSPDGAARHRDLLEAAELIFVDAAKDGAQERRFLALFEATAFRRPPIVVFDDILLWNMLAIWRGVRRPKLDLTSFGHWSGTGLVDFAEPPAPA